MGLTSVGSTPTFPINMVQSVKIMNLINLKLSKKIFILKLPFRIKTFKLIHSLNQIGIIYQYRIFFKKNKIPVFFKITFFFYKSNPFFRKITLISTSSKKFYISLKALIILNKILKSSILLISTPYGYITHKEAISKNLGGLLIALIS